jgi:hypothetical protein
MTIASRNRASLIGQRLAISSENYYFGANHTPTILGEYMLWAAPHPSIKFDVSRQ